MCLNCVCFNVRELQASSVSFAEPALRVAVAAQHRAAVFIPASFASLPQYYTLFSQQCVTVSCSGEVSSTTEAFTLQTHRFYIKAVCTVVKPVPSIHWPT